MVKRLKSAFTITELVIVIAVVAILAAVLIPTFANIINKAEESADTQTVTNINQILSAEEIVNGKPDTMYDAMQAVEEGGYKVENLTPTRDGYDMVWDEVHNRFALLDENGKTVYSAGDVSQDKWKLWKIVDGIPENYAEEGYSYYAGPDFNETAVLVSAGFDAGEKENIAVTLNILAGTEKDVTVRTNGGAFKVSAAESEVSHYGRAASLAVEAVAAKSYHEYGDIEGGITVRSGRFVLEKAQEIKEFTAEPGEGQSVDLVLPSGAGIKVFTVNNGEGQVTVTNGGAEFGSVFAEDLAKLTFAGSGTEPPVTEYTPAAFAVADVDGGVEITGIDGEVPATLVIPSEINGKKVVSIGKQAFRNETTLQKVVFFEGTEKLDQQAFDGCTALAAVILPQSLTEIGKGAFRGSGLTEIEIPANITAIGSQAFGQSTSLESVVLPASLTTIPQSMFSGCSALAQITLPENLTSLGSNAFTDCVLLQSVEIPAGVKSLETNAFKGCTALTQVTLHEGLEEIKGSAFNASGITSIVIPNSVTSIGSSAFFQCSKLESVVFGDGITRLESWGIFYQCTALRSVAFGTNIENISKDVFAGCDNLAEITISGENKHLSSQGNGIVQRDTKTLIWGFPTTDISATGATVIGDKAFYQVKGLTEITIPATVTQIGEQAFYGCEDLQVLNLNMTSVNAEKNTTIGSEAFAHCTSLRELHVGKDVSQVEFSYSGGESSYAPYFSNCPSLEVLTVDEGNDYLYSQDNCIIEKTTKTLVLGCKTSVIPDNGSVTSVGAHAFNGKGLTSADIPESVTSFGIYSFAHNNIETFYIPETVRKISMYALNDAGIKTVIFDPTSDIGIFAFGEGSAMTIYCIGTQVEWDTLYNSLKTTGDPVGNSNLISGTVYYFSETDPGTDGNYWHWAGEPGGEIKVW